MTVLFHISLSPPRSLYFVANDKTANTVGRLLSFPEKYYCRAQAYAILFSRGKAFIGQRRIEWRRPLRGSDAASVYPYPSRFASMDARPITDPSGAIPKPKR